MPKPQYEPQTEESRVLSGVVHILKDGAPGMVGLLMSSMDSLLKVVDNDPKFRSKVSTALDLIKSEWRKQ